MVALILGHPLATCLPGCKQLYASLQADLRTGNYPDDLFDSGDSDDGDSPAGVGTREVGTCYVRSYQESVKYKQDVWYRVWWKVSAASTSCSCVHTPPFLFVGVLSDRKERVDDRQQFSFSRRCHFPFVGTKYKYNRYRSHCRILSYHFCCDNFHSSQHSASHCDLRMQNCRAIHLSQHIN